MQQSYSSIQSNSLVATPARLGERVARIASSMVILVACLVLIGWQLDLSLVKSMMPGAATMKVNTAACLLLAGISLKLQMRQEQTARMTRIAKWCAFAIVTISVLTICEYIFGWNFGIDELLFPDPAALETSHPGRMGINTAICLSFTGTALWLIEWQERRSPNQPQHQVKVDRTTIAQILTTVTGAIALQAIVGYAYNVRVFYHLSQLTSSMAIHTALSLGILCVGILALTSDRGFMRALTSELIGGEVAKRFIPQAILVPLLIGWLILQGLQANLYDQNFALSLMSMSMVAIWLGLTRQNTGILNRVDYARIRAADLIRASEERLKLALQGAKQGIWDFDLQTQVLTWDDRCKEIFGLSPAALVTVDGHFKAIHPDDLQRVTTATEIAIRDCSEFSQEYRIVHADGTISWILTQGRCYCDPAGMPCRMSGTMMDITAAKRDEVLRQQAQATIQQQLGEIEAIYRSAPIGLSYISSELKFIRINEQLAQINGLSVAEHIGRTIREVLPEMANEIEQLYQQVIESGEPILDLEVSGITSAQPGANRCWLASYYPHKDAHSRVVGVSAVIQEITDRKRHEVELERQAAILRASEQKFSAIFNNTFGLIGLFGLDGTVLDLNQSALASIDGQSSDLIGQKCWETPLWTHSTQLQHQLKDSICQAASGQFVRYEVEVPTPSGGLTTTDFSLKPVFDRSGQVVTIVAEGRDITTLKQAQADLQQRNHELNSFAHIVSHDLKAPLRAVANLSQWIEDDLQGVLTADTHAQMTLLRSRVDRMRATIDGLLDYARAGRTEGTTEPVAVSELLLEVIDSLAPPPTFSIEIDPNLPTLNTNRILLFQVFANLIGNGIKHHERVDGSIQISSRECGDLYEFVIADDGPGIAPEFQANIFTIFQTGNCKNTQDSTGIGLAIVKKIVESEGGTIRLASEIDRGTTFYFTWTK